MAPYNRPTHVIRLGHIEAAIWEHPTDYQVYYNVVIQRTFRERHSEQWKNSRSFGPDDLPLVSQVAERARRWIDQEQYLNDEREDSEH